MTDRVFKRITVDVHFSPIVSRQVLVAWALEPSFVEQGPYTFTVYRADAPSQDLADLTPVARVVDQPWAYDNGLAALESTHDVFYRVVLEDGNGRTYESQTAVGTSYWSRYDWTLAREIIRKETLLLQKRAGVKGYLLKRRTFGDPCPCADPETEQLMDPDCEDCYGTPFKDGYYPPFVYWVLMNPTTSVVKLDADAGLLSASLETVRALAYPIPEPGDVWVHAHTDQRFVIQGEITALARHRGIDLVLQLQLSEADRSHPIYKVPIPCGL